MILDAPTKSVEENNKKTQPTESESISDLPEKDFLRNDFEPVVYSRRKISGKSKDTLIIPTRYQTEAMSNGHPRVTGSLQFLLLYSLLPRLSQIQMTQHLQLNQPQLFTKKFR